MARGPAADGPTAQQFPGNLFDRPPVFRAREEVFRAGQEAALEIHAVFTAETDAKLKLLRELSIETDRIKIGREAHSLKSAAGTFGYCELSSLAQRLERDAARLAASEYLALLDSMDATYARASAEELQR